MEAAEILAKRLMAQFKDRLPLKQICDEILVVLGEGGVRIGDPVPADLATEAEQRLAVVSSQPMRPRDHPHPPGMRPRAVGGSHAVG